MTLLMEPTGVRGEKKHRPINLPNQMKNVKIQIKDLFLHANMDTSEKMIIVLVSKSELNIGNYQNPSLLGYYRTVSIDDFIDGTNGSTRRKKTPPCRNSLTNFIT
jgi:hypothetical protein